MRAQSRDQGRSPGVGRPLLCGAIVFLALCLAACEGGGSGNRGGQAGPEKPPDPDFVLQYSKKLQQYIDALVLCGSANIRDWDQARRQLELLQPFYVFQEDPDLIRRFRAGSDEARRELARRGAVLHALTVFGRVDPVKATPIYDKAAWDAARQRLTAEGEVGQHLMVKTLFNLLLSGQYREVWDQIRFTLVETGPMALETAGGLARRLAEETPAQTAIFRIDDFVQVLLVLIGFGDQGHPVVEELGRSPKANVRRAVAKAIGDGVDGAGTPILVRLVSEDPEWVVRTQAAKALGRMAPTRLVAGRALADRMKKERDRTVLPALIEALGELHYNDAVPDLMLMLELPSAEVATGAMSALYHITGEKLTRKEQWQRWYATVYPEWKKRHPE